MNTEKVFVSKEEVIKNMLDMFSKEPVLEVYKVVSTEWTSEGIHIEIEVKD